MLNRYFTCAYDYRKYWENDMELKAPPGYLHQGLLPLAESKIGPVFNFEWIFDDSLTQNGPYSIFFWIEGKIIVTLQ